MENTEILESKNRRLLNQNRNIEIGKTEAEIRIKVKQLSRRIVTALIKSDLFTMLGEDNNLKPNRDSDEISDWEHFGLKSGLRNYGRLGRAFLKIHHSSNLNFANLSVAK